MARARELSTVERTMMHSVNWLEVVFNGKATLLDIDLETGALILYGTECDQFREKFNRMVEGVYNGKRDQEGE